MKKRIPRRRNPERGEVIAVPLPYGRVAYLVAIDEVTSYLCNFVTKGGVGDASAFGAGHWLRPVDYYGGFPRDYLTVARVEMPPDKVHPRMWKENPMWKVYGGARFLAYDGPGRPRPISEEETKTMPREVAFSYAKDLVRFIRSCELPVLELPEGESASSLPLPETEKRYEYDVVFEVDGMTAEQLAQAEEALAAALEEADSALYAEVDGGDTLVLSGPAGDKAAGIALLRRVLRKVIPPEEQSLIEITRLGEGGTRTALRMAPLRK